jgi:hypothetical protein
LGKFEAFIYAGKYFTTEGQGGFFTEERRSGKLSIIIENILPQRDREVFSQRKGGLVNSLL